MGAVLALVLAQGAVVPPLALPRMTVHVHAHEALEVDALRSLAKTGAVLWLHTEGAVLKESTVETLQRFSRAWVEVRWPVEDALVMQLRRVPGVGVWSNARPGPDSGLHRLGPRRRALVVQSPFDEEEFEALKAFSPSAIEWKPPRLIGLLEWAWLRLLPGEKVVSSPGAFFKDVTCEPGTRLGVRWRIDAFTLRRYPDFRPPCGASLRIRLEGVPEEGFIRHWAAQFPDVEWEMDVGADMARVFRLRSLLKQLEALSL